MCVAIIQEMNKQTHALGNVIDIIHELLRDFVVTNDMLVVENNFGSLNNRTSQTISTITISNYFFRKILSLTS